MFFVKVGFDGVVDALSAAQVTSAPANPSPATMTILVMTFPPGNRKTVSSGWYQNVSPGPSFRRRPSHRRCKLYPIPVRIRHHHDPRNFSEIDRRHRDLRAAALQQLAGCVHVFHQKCEITESGRVRDTSCV